MASKSDKELVYMPGGNGAAPAGDPEVLPALEKIRAFMLQLAAKGLPRHGK